MCDDTVTVVEKFNCDNTTFDFELLRIQSSIERVQNMTSIIQDNFDNMEEVFKLLKKTTERLVI